jgi:general secretion pathway protein J
MIRRAREGGFTLVEMLIALAIFGMIAAGSVALLSFSVRSQEMAERQLDRLSAIRRAGALLTADLAQAATRTWRDADGQQQPAFIGSGGRDARLLVMVRGGWDNPDGAARASLQRVEYRLQGGRLYRVGYAAVDGNAASAVASLIDDVSAVQLRYRARDGAWSEQWYPADPAELPLAVELVVTSERLGAIRQLFLVGSAA